MSFEKIDKNNIPHHIAVIMDGNGRWAKKRGMSREYGHRAGRKSVKKIVESCIELGIKNLTLYAFSTENWNRPKIEIDFLMQLLLLSLKGELKNLNKNNIKFDTIGNLKRLPKKIGNYLEKVKLETKENSKLTSQRCSTFQHFNISVTAYFSTFQHSTFVRVCNFRC